MSDQDPKPNEGMGCSMHFRQKEGCPICEAVSVAYAPKPSPKPVMVPILPRFDSEGRPSCEGCPICNNDWELGTACNGFFSAQETVQDISHSRPGPKCPIHNPQEQQEPL